MGPGATRSTASAAVEAVLHSIRQATLKEKLHIARFGTFETSRTKQRLTFRPAKGFVPPENTENQ